jgi:hypothetical protein
VIGTVAEEVAVEPGVVVVVVVAMVNLLVGGHVCFVGKHEHKAKTTKARRRAGHRGFHPLRTVVRAPRGLETIERGTGAARSVVGRASTAADVSLP